MIKKYNDFKAEKVGAPREILPAGGYVAKIMSAKVESFAWGDVLVMAFDITEGDFANFFKRDFDNNPNEDKRWRGTLRMNIPNDSADQQNEWRKRAFNNLIACLPVTIGIGMRPSSRARRSASSSESASGR